MATAHLKGQVVALPRMSTLWLSLVLSTAALQVSYTASDKQPGCVDQRGLHHLHISEKFNIIVIRIRIHMLLLIYLDLVLLKSGDVVSVDISHSCQDHLCIRICPNIVGSLQN